MPVPTPAIEVSQCEKFRDNRQMSNLRAQGSIFSLETCQGVPRAQGSLPGNPVQSGGIDSGCSILASTLPEPAAESKPVRCPSVLHIMSLSKEERLRMAEDAFDTHFKEVVSKYPQLGRALLPNRTAFLDFLLAGPALIAESHGVSEQQDEQVNRTQILWRSPSWFLHPLCRYQLLAPIPCPVGMWLNGWTRGCEPYSNLTGKSIPREVAFVPGMTVVIVCRIFNDQLNTECFALRCSSSSLSPGCGTTGTLSGNCNQMHAR